MQKKNLDSSPDETRTFEKGKVELANLDNVTIGRAGPRARMELGKMCKTSSQNE